MVMRLLKMWKLNQHILFSKLIYNFIVIVNLFDALYD